MPSTWQESRSVAPFSVVLQTRNAEAVVLRSVPDADQATIAVHQERHRLIQERVVGERLVIRHGALPRTLLRDPLSRGNGEAPEVVRAVPSERTERGS